MCPKCQSRLEMSYKSLNDTATKFYMEGRKVYIDAKKARNLIIPTLFSQAEDLIKKQKIFDIIECIECGEIVHISDDTEYTRLVAKEMEIATLEESKKTKDKTSLDGLTSGRTRSGKRIKEEVEIKAGGHVDTEKKKVKKKREISEEVRQQRRDRMKKMWEEKRSKRGEVN